MALLTVFVEPEVAVVFLQLVQLERADFELAVCPSRPTLILFATFFASGRAFLLQLLISWPSLQLRFQSWKF
jgi:hypothetical protein